MVPVFVTYRLDMVLNSPPSPYHHSLGFNTLQVAGTSPHLGYNLGPQTCPRGQGWEQPGLRFWVTILVHRPAPEDRDGNNLVSDLSHPWRRHQKGIYAIS
jgi:hypothetical protein